MNEATIGGFTAVKELNRVDGFDPTQVLRKILEPTNDGSFAEKCYLDVAYRKLWFRLKHPEGAIRKFVREITDQFAIVEAKIYLDRNDPVESYIANAIVKRYYSAEDKFGDKYLEIAETAAVGRALADAGFGIQFSDTNDVPDQNVVDSPYTIPQGSTVNTTTGELIQNTPTAPTQMPPMQNVQQAANFGNPTAPPQQLNFTPDMPVETILQQMTMEYAMNYMVDCGAYNGKKLGQVAYENPSALEWYINSYRGRNNILRAAAKFLIDKASAV